MRFMCLTGLTKDKPPVYVRTEEVVAIRDQAAEGSTILTQSGKTIRVRESAETILQLLEAAPTWPEISIHPSNL